MCITTDKKLWLSKCVSLAVKLPSLLRSFATYKFKHQKPLKNALKLPKSVRLAVNGCQTFFGIFSISKCPLYAVTDYITTQKLRLSVVARFSIGESVSQRSRNCRLKPYLNIPNAKSAEQMICLALFYYPSPYSNATISLSPLTYIYEIFFLLICYLPPMPFSPRPERPNNFWR